MKENQKLNNNEKPNKMKVEMWKKEQQRKTKTKMQIQVTLFKDLRIRPFGHDNSLTPMLLIVGIENVHAL